MEGSRSRSSKVSLATGARRSDGALRQLDDHATMFLCKDYTWHCFTMTPPSELTRQRLTERLRELTQELERRFDNPKPTAIGVRPCTGLDLTTSCHPPLLFFVSFVGDARKKKLCGLLSNVGSDQYHLLLCRGSRRAMNLVVRLIGDAFRCHISPLILGVNDLAFGLAYWSVLVFRTPGFDKGSITIQLSHQIVTDWTIELDLPVGHVGQVLDGDKDIDEDDGLRALEVLFRAKLVRTSTLDLKSFKLRSIHTAGLNFSSEGNVKFVKREFAGEALAYLTSIAERKVEPKTRERTIGASH